MPPAAKRNASVILYDVKTQPEFAENAKRCLLNIFATKLFSQSKDDTKLILLNTEETDNAIHSKHDGKCPHVKEATHVIQYDPKEVAPLLENVETAEADWLIGLAAALEAIRDNFYDTKGVMNLQLLFITDFSTPVNSKDSRITFIINNLNKMGVHLYIFGPEVKVPNLMSSVEDIKQWSKNIEFVADEEANPNLSIAKQIVQNTKAIICDLKLGQELFGCYNELWSLQSWKVPLTVGGTLSIPCSTTRFLRAVAGPRFKAETLDGFEDQWKWHPVDDALEEVPFSNVIGGVFKHGKFVPLPNDIEQEFKYKGPRGFKIIGFTDQSNVSELYMVGDGSSYVESENSTGFKLLVDVLAKQNKCAIAQKIYNMNCRPKLVALLPQPKEGIFILVDLPYGDSIGCNFIEQDINEAPKFEKDTPIGNAMYEYLQKLDVTDPNNRENGFVKVPLAANLMNPLQLNIVNQQCLQKYLDEESNTEQIDIKLPELVEDIKYKELVILQPKEEPVEIKSENKDV